MRIAAVLVLLVACGDDGSSATPIDAPPSDVPPDMTPDMVDAFVAPTAPAGHYHYVIDRLLVPETNAQARDYALDLDGNGVVDNQLGMVFGTLAAMGMGVTDATTRAIDRGESITLVDLVTTDLTTSATASVALFASDASTPAACANAADTVCRRHLAGTGAFTTLAVPVDPPLPGAFAAGTFTAGPGALSLPLVWPQPFRVALLGARMKITAASASSLGSVVIAGGITTPEIQATIIPKIRDGFQASVTADCPTTTTPPLCGCPGGSAGATALALFDGSDGTAKDCAISIAEVRDNSLIQSLLAPDVMINGVQALSVGVNARAVLAAFADPI